MEVLGHFGVGHVDVGWETFLAFVGVVLWVALALALAWRVIAAATTTAAAAWNEAWCATFAWEWSVSVWWYVLLHTYA